MIHHLHGQLQNRDSLQVVVDVSGVGYGVTVPLSTLERLGPVGSTVELFIHTDLRQDALELFGFATREEKRLFLLLKSISGIGPKTAINMLSRLNVAQLAGFIRDENDEELARTPGIGPKRAKKIIIELKDKLEKDPLLVGIMMVQQKGSVEDEILLALLSLGYTKKQAEDAIQKIDSTKAESLEERIKACLNYLSKH